MVLTQQTPALYGDTIEFCSFKKKSEGFSLIEILVALAIVGLIAAIAVPAYMRYLAGAKVKKARIELKSIKNQIDIYQIDTNQYPTRLDDLIKAPAGVEGWGGPYFEKKQIPLDPWGNKYQYRLTPESGENPYELYSYGPDKKKGPKIDAWKI